METVRAELEVGGKLGTSLGAMCVFLAERLSASTFHTGSAVAAVSRELRATMTAALADVRVANDPLDELRARRDRKRLMSP